MNYSWVPFVAAGVAIALFLLKETIEFCRRQHGRKQNGILVESLVAQEIQRNYLYFYISVGAFSKIATQSSQNGFAARLHKNSLGEVSCEITSVDGTSLTPLPQLSTKYFDLLIGNISQLGSDTFASVHKAYLATEHINHARNMLISDLENVGALGCYSDSGRSATQVHKHKNDYFHALQSAYKLLIGDDLNVVKLE